MKFNFCVIILSLITLCSFSQNKVAVVSAFGLEMAVEDGSSINNLIEYINDNDLHNKSIAKRMEDINTGFGSLFEVASTDFLNQPFYKNCLNHYEYAPEDVKFNLVGYDVVELEKVNQEYRLSDHQVVFLENYLAMSNAKPFNNKDALAILFENMPDVKGLIFLEFDASNGFVGSPYGVGKATSKITMRVKIINRELKSVYKTNISGKSPEKFDVPLKDFDAATISGSFDSAIDELIAAIADKSKKVAKIKW